MSKSIGSFLKLKIMDESSIGGGQMIKVDEESQQNIEEFKKTLVEILKVDLSLYKISYIDSDKERIDIVDPDDWTTCVEEFFASPESLQNEGLQILIVKMEVRKGSKEFQNSMVSHENIIGSNTSYHNNNPPEEPKVVEQLPRDQQLQKIVDDQNKSQNNDNDTNNNTPERYEGGPSKQISVAKPDIISHAPTPQPVVIQQEIPVAISYKFGYTEEELMTIKKVVPSLYSKIEDIFVEKIEAKMVEGERAFKLYHQQQVKYHTDKLQKKVEELTKLVRSYKETIDNTNKPATRMLFSNAIITPNYQPPGDSLPITPNQPQDPVPQSPKDQGQSEKYAHLETSCDQCSTLPIKGIRYKSLYKRNFDLCEACFLDDSNTKDPYLALRESAPQDLNHLVMLARSSQVPSYVENNSEIQRYYRWDSDGFRDIARIEKQLDNAINTFFH